MLRSDKEKVVAELAAELQGAETLIVADYRGLTNKQLEALRDELIPHGARFRIVKNTLTRRAAEQAGAESLLVMLEGPTAIAFIETDGDPAAVAKALAATAKQTNVLTLRGGVLEGQDALGRRGRPARDAAAGRRPPRTARRRDHRAGHAARGTSDGPAPESVRARRGEDQAAGGGGRGRDARAGGDALRGGGGARGGSRAEAEAEAEAPEAEAAPEAEPRLKPRRPRQRQRQRSRRLRPSKVPQNPVLQKRLKSRTRTTPPRPSPRQRKARSSRWLRTFRRCSTRSAR